jgi:hypothetical protein
MEAAPPGAKKGWEPQVGFSLKCVSGEDAGMDARYTVTSVGGRRAVQALAVEIATQVDKDQSKPVPVVKLGKDSYSHKSYGRIFTPVFAVQTWIGMDGGEVGEDSDAPAEPAPSGRRRRAA